MLTSLIPALLGSNTTETSRMTFPRSADLSGGTDKQLAQRRAGLWAHGERWEMNAATLPAELWLK